MNLLYSNDKRGAYPDSWYAATVDPLPPFGPLHGETQADVCVIGGGYTGLSAALHLREMGFDVVLLDAQRVGFGASGRNGGQLHSGQRMGQTELERLVGRDDARTLWHMAEEAKTLVKDLIARHNINCYLRPGIAEFGFNARQMDDLHRSAEKKIRDYGYDQITLLDQGAGAAICPSPAYHGGYLDMGAAHLHPLAYALGLAQAASRAGVRIYEGSQVHHITQGTAPIVQTDRGRVKCRYVVMGCNGYLGHLNMRVAARVMPINNFIAATEPLGDDAARVLAQDVAVADTKFVINYFRLSHDKRLLFGGGESYGYKFPRDISATVRKPMTQIFPHLRDVRIDYAWGGTLGITVRRMPYFTRIAENILSASGYSGHGVGTATHAGQLMALAIGGQAQGFDTMARVPALPFPGGGMGRTPLLAMAMTWYALRDRLGV